jgi:hypothetical protein
VFAENQYSPTLLHHLKQRNANISIQNSTTVFPYGTRNAKYSKIFPKHTLAFGTRNANLSVKQFVTYFSYGTRNANNRKNILQHLIYHLEQEIQIYL